MSLKSQARDLDKEIFNMGYNNIGKTHAFFSTVYLRIALYIQRISKVLEKGPDKVFVAVPSFIPHSCYDSVSGEGWCDREKQGATERNATDGRCLHKQNCKAVAQPVWADP